MMQRFGMAFGAGLAAALLFVAVLNGTPLAAAIACLAPLPIVIAALGWGLEFGGLAGAMGCGIVAALVHPLFGGLFAAVIALPGWLLSVLSLAPRDGLSALAGRANDDRTNSERAWFPIGGVVAFAALLGALVAAGALASLILMYGGFQSGVDALSADMLARVKDAAAATSDSMITLPAGLSVEEYAGLVMRLWPALFAACFCLLFCVNLYAGARAVQLSQRLKRPWPNVPEALVLPHYLGFVFIACIGLAFILPGAGGQLAWMGVGALVCAYAMQGLAVAHSLSRGLPARIPMLATLYLACFGATLLLAPVLALAGLAESFLSLRARRAAAANVKS